MKLLNKTLGAILVAGLVTSSALAKNLAVTYTYSNDIGEKFEKFVHEELKSNGIYVNDPHPNVQDVYKKDFKKTKMDYIGFASLVNDDVVRELLNIDPRLGGFTPFNLLRYKKSGDSNTVVSHLTAEAMLDILEIDNKDVRTKFTGLIDKLDGLIESKLPGAKKGYLPVKGQAKDTMMNYEITFDEPEEFDDFMDEFEEKFRSEFGQKGFIIAGFYNVKDSLNSKKDVMPEYRTYWSFDLCHVPFSYAIFDGDAGESLAEAGIFAPCSIYVYVRKGENKIVIGMPSVEVWSASFDVKDDAKLRFMDRMDTEIGEIFESLGGKPVANGNPLKK